MNNSTLKLLIKETISKISIEEDYPTNFNMDEFYDLKSFNQRIQFCEKYLQRISSGSARIVYKIDEQKVLKLAKNQKGIAQNETEIYWGNSSDFEDILAKTFNHHSDDLWVEMEYAKKITPTKFKQLTNFYIGDVYDYLSNFQSIRNGKKPYFNFDNDFDPELKKELDNSKFLDLIKSFMENSRVRAGDMGRVSTYGIVNRNGKELVVIVDYGLTEDVFDTHYARKRY